MGSEEAFTPIELRKSLLKKKCLELEKKHEKYKSSFKVLDYILNFLIIVGIPLGSTLCTYLIGEASLDSKNSYYVNTILKILIWLSSIMVTIQNFLLKLSEKYNEHSLYVQKYKNLREKIRISKNTSEEEMKDFQFEFDYLQEDSNNFYFFKDLSKNSKSTTKRDLDYESYQLDRLRDISVVTEN